MFRRTFSRRPLPRRRPAVRRPGLHAAESLEPRAVMAIAVAGALPDLVLAPSATPAPIDTAAEFSVSGVTAQGTVVKFAMQSGDDASVRPLFIELYDKEIRGANDALLRSAAPVSTANFLSYVDAGAYDATFIHRATDFAGDAAGSSAKFLQGGSYINTGSGVRSSSRRRRIGPMSPARSPTPAPTS